MYNQGDIRETQRDAANVAADIPSKMHLLGEPSPASSSEDAEVLDLCIEARHLQTKQDSRLYSVTKLCSRFRRSAGGVSPLYQDGSCLISEPHQPAVQRTEWRYIEILVFPAVPRLLVAVSARGMATLQSFP